ncbi:BFH_collapsed_G0020660.mRNA.1.CDS.1 [Saccharomyces cerevisiae]|nr:YGR066C-like protein [Saccharomyces cerevisiae VL3]CAI4472584.1 CAS_1a_G0020580.mRNA.1.CDS.1 [Saccharomyces cerevisiae]CAI4476154.1 AIC_G0020600.mRNA.1.CDS.1 [Saccharomyces cerevisiae]CAI4482086.1 AFI_G0020510.mRNA.1.CDS.1 [Saccharomyces cerevisiae]CAI5275060.1 BFH_HP2_G0020330.mRNA.1.CDS.1 [Saccharomyces cerevisiae]
MTSLNIMGRKFILERAKRNDNIEEIYTSAYVSLPSSTDTRLPHFKAKEEDCDVYEEGTNLVGKNAKYTYRSLGRHLDFFEARIEIWRFAIVKVHVLYGGSED